MGESDGDFLVMRPLTLTPLADTSAQTITHSSYSSLESTLFCFCFCCSFRGGYVGGGGGISGAPSHCWSAKAELVGGIRKY